MPLLVTYTDYDNYVFASHCSAVCVRTEFRIRVLTRMLLSIGGTEYPARFRVVSDYVHKLQSHYESGKELKQASLVCFCSIVSQALNSRILKEKHQGGCLLAPQADKRMVVCREATVERPLPLRLGDTVLWDHRFLISARVIQARPESQPGPDGCHRVCNIWLCAPNGE